MSFINAVLKTALTFILKCGVGCAQQGFRAFGLFVIFIACALITCVVYTQAHLVVPAIFPRNSFGFWASMGITFWLSAGVWVNYLGSLGCDPGVIPRGFRFQNLPNLHYPPRNVRVVGSTPAPVYTGPRVRACETCDAHKPPRTHHCSLCGQCVAKMDHHCPWINSCVGYHNQRYFVSFLLYLLFGTLFCGLHSAYVMYRTDIYPAALTGHSLVLFSGIICAALHFAMWFFVGWNAFLALTNQTAIEFQINRAEAAKARFRGEVYRNPFDLGMWANFVDLFATAGEDFYFYASPKLYPVTYTDGVDGGEGGVGSLARLQLKTAVSHGVFWMRRAWHVVYLTFPTVRPMPGNGRSFKVWQANNGPAAA